ncbi:MAG: hypothetical protein HUJ25_11825 [Crocinitomicaceae bacterium]|nr:hypothetical protein [Crocinitomicaceae bacterium]
MTDLTKDSNKENALDIIFKATKKPRFKAGSELSAKVNLVDINLNQESTEEMESIEVKVKVVETIDCDPNPCD